MVLSLIDRGFRIRPDILQRFPGLENRANRYLPLLRKIVSAVIAFMGFVALLEVWGVDAVVWFYGGQIGSRLVSAVVTIGIAALAAAAIWEVANALMDRQLTALSRDGHYARAARLRTFQPMLRTVLLCVIVAVVGLTTLSEIGVNVAPLLAGAGIVGIAIGFGSQKLVQDLITGLFLLLENTVQVGDNVTVSGLSGTVENVSIRTIRLRAGDGSVHIVPFSAVTTLHQFQPWRRQCGRQRQCFLQGRHRPRRRDTEGYRRRDAPRGRIPPRDPRRSRIVGRRQGGRFDGVDRRPDPLHRQRPLAGAARIQPAHEAAIPGRRNRNRLHRANHLDADSASLPNQQRSRCRDARRADRGDRSGGRAAR